jgi:hypothetical protein
MAFLDTVNTITRKTIVPGMVDQVFKSGPTMAYIKRNCLAKYAGGPSWQENFLYGMLDVQAYNPGDTFDIIQQQIFTGGTVTPRYYNVPVPALIEKVKLEMAGPEAVFNYVDTLMQTAALTMSAKLATDIFRHGQTGTTTGDRTKYINGLAEALNDGDVGAVGDTIATGPFTEHYATYLTLTRNDPNIGTALNSPITASQGSVAGYVNGAISYPILEQAYNSVVYGTESPDLIVTTNKGMSLIKMAFHAQQRYEGTTADFGFQGVKFNGATIFQDRYAPGSDLVSAQEAAKLGRGTSGSAELAGETIWFLNTKYIRFYLSTDSLFGFGFTGFLPAQDNSLVVGHYKFAGNMTVQAPRLMRVLWGIS